MMHLKIKSENIRSPEVPCEDVRFIKWMDDKIKHYIRNTYVMIQIQKMTSNRIESVKQLGDNNTKNSHSQKKSLLYSSLLLGWGFNTVHIRYTAALWIVMAF